MSKRSKMPKATRLSIEASLLQRTALIPRLTSQRNPVMENQEVKEIVVRKEEQAAPPKREVAMVASQKLQVS
jgi:hypothetical protein